MNKKYIKLVTVYTVALSPSWGCTRPSAMGQLRLIVQTAQVSQAEVAHTGGSGSTNWGTDFAITWTGASSVWRGPSRAVSGGAICGEVLDTLKTLDTWISV